MESPRSPWFVWVLLVLSLSLASGACSLVTGFGDFVVDEGGDGDSDSDSDGDSDADICEPRCAERNCGPDGCGGECGRGCNPPAFCNEDGQGEGPCEPDCFERECGHDGCGGQCPPGCPAGWTCDVWGFCFEECVPDCRGRSCGPDGCDGECQPGCSDTAFCDPDGQCVNGCLANCEDRECGPDGCGGVCGECRIGHFCNAEDGYCFASSCTPGTRLGAPCRPDRSCDAPYECLHVDFAMGPGVCSTSCSEGDTCPASSGGGFMTCVELPDSIGAWCLYDCGYAACPCDVRCVTLGDTGLGVCYP